MEWLIILAVTLAATGLGLGYLAVCVGRFALVRRLSGGKTWRRRLLSLGIVAAVFAALALWLSFVNAIVIFLHLVLFFLLFGLGVRLARRLTGRDFRINWQGWLALGFSLIWLTVGCVQCFRVWEKDYRLETEKDLGVLRIALIADCHLGTTFDGRGFAAQLQTIRTQGPDLLVIAGDFVDDSSSREDLELACRALGALDLPYGVWYVHGNHDRGYGRGRDFSGEELDGILRENGVHVLRDECALVDGRFYVAGREDASRGRRLEIEELLAGLDTDKYIIVLDHQPNDYENEARSPADLVLSGHSHGGQLIPITHVGEAFGLLDRAYGHERRQGTDFIVTSGISCWEILFKTGTRSEYVIITVTG